VTPLLIALGAAVGAPLRYLTDQAVRLRHGTAFPWGTLTVNVIGSFLLGLVLAAATAFGPGVVSAIGVGFCGALTTYSTFSHETVRLLEQRALSRAAAYVVVSVLAGLGAALIGFTIGQLVA
jgi:CrcB protein